jgi:heme exporter protein B
MFRDATFIFAKDARIEWRAKVTLRQVAPFVVTLIALFGFAFDRLLIRDSSVADVRTDQLPVAFVAPGVYWLGVLFSLVLLVQRSVGIETEDGAGTQLRLWGLDPSGVFLGKAAMVAVQLAAIQLLLLVGIVAMFGLHLSQPLLLVTVAVLATIGLSAVGSAYGALSASLRVRETLLPVLLLPVTVPVLLASVQAWQRALTGDISSAWPWARILLVFAVVYVAFGVLSYGSLMEES